MLALYGTIGDPASARSGTKTKDWENSSRASTRVRVIALQ